MIKVIGVRFRTAGKVYFFDPLHFEIKRGDHVIVETARGIEFGTVVSGVHEVEDDKVIQPLKPVIRVANQRDIEQEAGNKIREREAYKICLEKIRKHELEMKLIDAEYTFDNNKVLFYFTADGRIDFRELVKDLASVFKTRIELRQIGVRDETKIMGGIGICGRPLCCHSYLSDFVPVSIKMAKEQNLSLNPTKISGVCGRLMCCLKNEEETYEYLNRRLPGIGDYVTTDDGLKGEVQSVNVLRQLVKVVVENGDEKEIREYEVDSLQFRRKHNKKEKLELSREEMKELERLEQEEHQDEQESKPERRSDRRNSRQNDRSTDRENDRFADKVGDKTEEMAAESHVETKHEKFERRNDRRRENRGENREDNRGEGRGENRRDNRNEERRENRNESRSEERRENRADNRSEERRENRNENRSEERGDNREYRRNRRNDRRNDNRRNNAGEAQQNGEAANAAPNAAELQKNVNQQERRQNRNENRGEEQQEKNNDPQGEGRQGEGRQGRKYYRRDRRDRREGRKQENHDN